MVRQKLTEPFVPCQIDLMQRCGVAFCPVFDQRRNPEIDVFEVRIGAEIIPNHNGPLGRQMRDPLL